IERAAEGMDGDQLIAAVKEEFPNTPLRSIAHAAFIAVTRPSVSPEALSSIYNLAIGARRPRLNETMDR
ncbi:MAG TPA: hypothetical protein VMJ31_11000, partial [Methylocystis sp.]|nr:hypothetical protein [Methylocystis sp.]